MCPPFPPSSVPQVQVSLTLGSTPCARSDPASLRCLLASSHLDSLPPADLTIWTDGSVHGTFGPGGGAAILLCSTCFTSSSHLFRGSQCSSSANAEMLALGGALDCALTHASSCSFQSVLVLSDSQSCLSALDSPPSFLLTASLFKVWSSISSLSSRSISVRLQWVPGHSLLPGNELADVLAKSAVTLPLPPSAPPSSCSQAPQPLAVLSASIRHQLFSSWRSSVSSRLLPHQVPLVSSEEQSLPRNVRCNLSRLRCNGHSLLLNSYRHRIGLSPSSSCSKCGHVDHDASHLFSCPATSSLRLAIFGPQSSLVDLWCRPWGVARLLGFRGLGPCPHPKEGVG